MDTEANNTQIEDYSSSSNKSPKKTKRYQVKVACIPCKKRHAGCSTERPCAQCVKNGTESQCIDELRKRRRGSVDIGSIQDFITEGIQCSQNRRSFSVDFTNSFSSLMPTVTDIHRDDKPNKSNLKNSGTFNYKFSNDNNWNDQPVVITNTENLQNNNNTNHSQSYPQIRKLDITNYDMVGRSLTEIENLALTHIGEATITLPMSILRDIIVKSFELNDKLKQANKENTALRTPQQFGPMGRTRDSVIFQRNSPFVPNRDNINMARRHSFCEGQPIHSLTKKS
jgi:hypothetical protein